MEEFKPETNLIYLSIFDYVPLKVFLGFNLAAGSQDWKIKNYLKEILH